jgi:hypothetical protein
MWRPFGGHLPSSPECRPRPSLIYLSPPQAAVGVGRAAGAGSSPFPTRSLRSSSSAVRLTVSSAIAATRGAKGAKANLAFSGITAAACGTNGAAGPRRCQLGRANTRSKVHEGTCAILRQDRLPSVGISYMRQGGSMRNDTGPSYVPKEDPKPKERYRDLPRWGGVLGSGRFSAA